MILISRNFALVASKIVTCKSHCNQLMSTLLVIREDCMLLRKRMKRCMNYDKERERGINWVRWITMDGYPNETYSGYPASSKEIPSYQARIECIATQWLSRENTILNTNLMSKFNSLRSSINDYELIEIKRLLNWWWADIEN